MQIIITGLPGTGKTTIAKELEKILKSPLYTVKSFTKAKEVDISSLKKKTEKELNNKDSWILEGHIFCEYKIKSDFIFLLTRQEKELRLLYKKRKYSPEKIEENLFCKEINYFEKKLNKFYKTVYTIEVSENIKENIKKIIRIIGKANNK